MKFFPCIFAAAAALSCLALSGCADDGPVTLPVTGPTGPTVAKYVYALDEDNNKIQRYSATGSGLVTAGLALTLPSTAGQNTLSTVATDSNGQVYAGYADNNTGLELISVYAANATSTSAPLRTITTQYATGGGPRALTVDSQGLIYLRDNDSESISVYAASATGTATPIRTITGANTGITQDGNGLAVDASGTIYTAELGLVDAYTATANGNAAPTRIITPSPLRTIYTVAVDSSSNLYISTYAGVRNQGTQIGVLAQYGPTANGTATPLKTITSTQYLFLQVQVDTLGNIYTGTGMSSAGIYGPNDATTNIVAYSATATGAATPTYAFNSSTLYVDQYFSVAIH